MNTSNKNLITKNVTKSLINKIAIRAFLLFLSTSSLISCKKNEAVAYKPTAQALSNLFNISLNNIKQTATFDAATTFTFTSAQGTTITIDGTCLRKNGNPVTGNVELEFVELYDRASMAMTNKPTIGINASNEEEVLESGGEFYLNVTQNGVSLTTTCYIPIEVPTAITGGTKTGMQPFNGTTDANGKLTWEVAPASDFYVKTNPDKYASVLPAFGWFNCDRFYNDPRPKTHITVLVPAGYANASTVFLSTNAVPNSLGGIGGSKYPVGLDCNIIFVTEENGNFRYAIKPMTLVADQHVTFSISETRLATAAQFKAALNALP
ncbi:MAG: hypothetical protein U0U67_08830 [Chitinophagales bacterium]